MSLSTQKKFLQHCQDEAEVRNLVLVVDNTYANTGTVRFQRMESFVPLVTFGYDFQQGYARFHGDLGREHRTGIVGARSVKFDDLDTVLEDLRALLPGGRRKA